jgi:hypothetical protein
MLCKLGHENVAGRRSRVLLIDVVPDKRSAIRVP